MHEKRRTFLIPGLLILSTLLAAVCALPVNSSNVDGRTLRRGSLLVLNGKAVYRENSKSKINPEWLSALSKIAVVKTGYQRFHNGEEKKEFVKNEPKERNEGGKDAKNLEAKKFDCRPTDDVFIPDVQKKMPAYVCRSKSKSFVLSSSRFYQDKRDRLDVNVDGFTFRRLDSAAGSKKSLTPKILSARLVLKNGEENYNIERYEV